MADEAKTDGPQGEPTEGKIPPKLNLSSSSLPSEPAKPDPKSETIHIKMPSDLESSPEAPKLVIKPGGVAKPAVRLTPSDADEVAESGSSKKKETSRIPLEDAVTSPGEGVGKPTQAPKTIRIKPITKKAQVVTDAVPSPKSQTAPLDDKRKTSRISLDSVFKADAAEESTESQDTESERPKTIRLKRPSEAATIKIAQRPKPAVAPVAPPSEAKTVLSKTSRIDDEGGLGEEDDGGISPTRRKTIRVKRPTEQPGVRSLSIKRSEDEVAEEARQFMAPIVVEDQPNAVFPILAIAAILVVCVTVYMFMSQTFGYNACLTQTSYWTDGPNLGWPGKMLPPPR